jgi:hypothetical protein
MLYLSAFDPSLGGQDGWLGTTYLNSDSDGTAPDKFNNWLVTFLFNGTGYLTGGGAFNDADEEFGIYSQMVPRQLWVQTSSDSIACTMGNATRDVHFGFIEGVQTISYSDLQDFEPIFIPRMGPNAVQGLNTSVGMYTYSAAFMAMTSMPSSNITTSITSNSTTNFTILQDSSSRALLTGLVACDEIAHSFWEGHPVDGRTGLSHYELHEFCNATIPNGTDPNETPQNNTGGPLATEWPSKVENTLFDHPPWMCRNRTLAKAIDDLATNITISMMSAPQLM